MSLGSFTLVLHGHLPWVLKHGRWPHGESWLYEAALGTYLPLLGVLDAFEAERVNAPFALGLTPILLEQLHHPDFRSGLDSYLDARLRRARSDGQDLEFALLAAHWEGQLLDIQARYRAIDRDIPAAFARHARAGRLELLSSFATHGYAPLILHDASIRGQLRSGLDISYRHLGFRPTGIWLPECAFRPAGPWTPPVLHSDVRARLGVDRILEEEGVTHFFTEAVHFQGIRSEGVIEAGQFQKVGWDDAERFAGRAWRSVLEPHLINTTGGPSKVAAFARHPRLSEQVWSADVGFPGDPSYLEFHKRLGEDGLRYWRITNRKLGLGDKLPYRPDAANAATRGHAAHFHRLVRQTLAEHAATGRDGCVTATFDAELFGHWWHEGPRFLYEALRQLALDPEIVVETPASRLLRVPPDKVAWLPEGSWGEGGDHRVWFNDALKWMWEAAYRAEDRFLGLLWDVSQAGNPPRAMVLVQKAARELLLLQASDWQFVIHTGGAVDYGYQRFCGHLGRFDKLATMTLDLVHDRGNTGLQELEELEADAHDPCLADLPLAAWG